MNMRKGIGIVVFIIVTVLVLSALVRWLWNFAVVPAFGVPSLDYWQAMALLVLSKILFGGFRGGPGAKYWGKRPSWRGKWSNMSPEEREKFRDAWRRKCEKRRDSDTN